MKVSLIMPVFNAGDYLTEALNSVFENACAGVDLEILLVDDCSSDPNTLARLASLSAHPQVRVLRHEKNAGPSAARNTGIRAAHGDWIAFLDADDLMAAGTMELRFRLVNANPQIRWLAGDMLEMRQRGELTHHRSFPVNGNYGSPIADGIYLLPQPVSEMVKWDTHPVLGSMFIARDLIDEIGLFDESLIYGEDIHFCLVAAALSDLYWVEHPCLYLRRHHESMTKDLLRLASESPRYTRRLLGDPRLNAVRKQLRWQHASNLRRKAKISLLHNLRWRSLLAALCSIFWTPNDMNSYRAVFKAVSGQTGTVK